MCVSPSTLQTFIILINLRSSFSLSWAFSCWIIRERTLMDKEGTTANKKHSQGIFSRCFLFLPIAHVVKVLGELRQVGTLLLILLLGPEQHLRNLQNNRKAWTSGLELTLNLQTLSQSNPEIRCSSILKRRDMKLDASTSPRDFKGEF